MNRPAARLILTLTLLSLTQAQYYYPTPYTPYAPYSPYTPYTSPYLTNTSPYTSTATPYAKSYANTSATYDPLTGCIDVNSTLAAQVGSITLASDPINRHIVNASCQNVFNLSANMNNVINSATGNAVNVPSSGNASKSAKGGSGLLGGLLGGVLGTVGGLLQAVLNLVNGLVGGLVQQNCTPADGVVYRPTATAVSVVDVEVCFNPNSQVIVNVKTGAYAQVDANQAAALAGLMNSLASASGNVEVQTPVGTINVNNSVAVQQGNIN